MSNEKFVNMEKIDPDSDVQKNYDPVMCRIWNDEKEQYGEPFVACRRHYYETIHQLLVTAPHCHVEIIGLMPVNPNCNNCIGDVVESEGLAELNTASVDAISFNRRNR